MKTRLGILFASVILLALWVQACSQDSAATDPSGLGSESFEWVVLSDPDLSALGLSAGEVELFSPRKDQVMLADSLAVDLIGRKHPEIVSRLGGYFRQFIGVRLDGTPSILVNYLQTPIRDTSSDARSSIEYWYHALPSVDNPPDSWVQVLVDLESLEPSILYEHL